MCAFRQKQLKFVKVLHMPRRALVLRQLVFLLSPHILVHSHCQSINKCKANKTFNETFKEQRFISSSTCICVCVCSKSKCVNIYVLLCASIEIAMQMHVRKWPPEKSDEVTVAN